MVLCSLSTWFCASCQHGPVLSINMVLCFLSTWSCVLYQHGSVLLVNMVLCSLSTWSCAFCQHGPVFSINMVLCFLSTCFSALFNTIFVSSHMHPENPEETQVIEGSTNMGYISDTASLSIWSCTLCHLGPVLCQHGRVFCQRNSGEISHLNHPTIFQITFLKIHISPLRFPPWHLNFSWIIKNKIKSYSPIGYRGGNSNSAEEVLQIPASLP